MTHLPRTIASAAMLLSGTALSIYGLLLIGNLLGILILLIGIPIFLFGLYGCCRILDIKIYSGQADLDEK